MDGWGQTHSYEGRNCDFIPCGWTTTPISRTSPLYQGARAAVTKFPKLGSFKKRSLFPHSPGNQKAKFKLPARLAPAASSRRISHCLGSALSWSPTPQAASPSKPIICAPDPHKSLSHCYVKSTKTSQELSLKALSKSLCEPLKPPFNLPMFLLCMFAKSLQPSDSL